ncbi:MAG: glycosyltransferase [Planctomycetaceae bacterium]
MWPSLFACGFLLGCGAMHVLFIHKNFPAQFGHIAARLAARPGQRCTFLSEAGPAVVDGVEVVPYRPRGGATQATHYCSRTFENATWHSAALYETLKARPDLRPDLVVAHSGFSSPVFLRELYDCPIVNYFEYYYHARGSDLDFRPDFPASEWARLRAHTRNALLLVDLENCDAGYSPTLWQRSLFPARFQPKLEVIFDGIDTSVWRRSPDSTRVFGGLTLPGGGRLLTYVARGFESMRGFDIFMQVARRLCDRHPDLVVAVVGEDRICYGGDGEQIGGTSFRDWVLARDTYDLSRILFLGRLAPRDLARLLSLSDLHIYLTVPFVLSWSLMNALACGTTVLASNTPPVREMIVAGQTGLLADFFDIDALVSQADAVLRSPADYRHLGNAGQRLIHEQYSLDVCLPRMEQLYERALNRPRAG